LHWVGFDPQSALPPPNKDTTHALAFISHDFVGRIVEKAILLRNQLQKERENCKSSNSTSSSLVLNELQAGERLSEADIDRAMQDPDIKPQPIYGASSNNDKNGKIVGTQLYFGPGFEKRLELEMEEIIQTWDKRKNKSDDLPDGDDDEEEMQIRQEEQALFQKLSAPPSLGVAGLLGGDPTDDMDDDDAKPAARMTSPVAGTTLGNEDTLHLSSTASASETAGGGSTTSEPETMQSSRAPKRGRPKGSKNKAKAQPPTRPSPMEQQQDATISKEESASPPKRKVGRPRGSKAKTPKAPLPSS
jgi:hypothetical protein